MTLSQPEDIRGGILAVDDTGPGKDPQPAPQYNGRLILR